MTKAATFSSPGSAGDRGGVAGIKGRVAVTDNAAAAVGEVIYLGMELGVATSLVLISSREDWTGHPPAISHVPAA